MKKIKKLPNPIVGYQVINQNAEMPMGCVSWCYHSKEQVFHWFNKQPICKGWEVIPVRQKEAVEYNMFLRNFPGY